MPRRQRSDRRSVRQRSHISRFDFPWADMPRSGLSTLVAITGFSSRSRSAEEPGRLPAVRLAVPVTEGFASIRHPGAVASIRSHSRWLPVRGPVPVAWRRARMSGCCGAWPRNDAQKDARNAVTTWGRKSTERGQLPLYQSDRGCRESQFDFS